MRHPVTVEYLEILRGNIQRKREALGRGDSLDSSRAFRTLALTARAVGYIEGVEAAIGVGLEMSERESG